VNAVAYPTSVIKNYVSCASCHVHPHGGLGGVLNDYGRGMSEAFMATFASEGEAQELFATSVSWLDLGIDYRWARIDSSYTDQFHMLTEIEAALHFDKITLDYSLGKYGRDKKLESRRHYIKYSPTNSSAVWIGKFMPYWGIGFSDHTLFIKSLTGLSRGSEIHGIGGWWKNKIFQLYGSYGSRDLRLASLDDGKYELCHDGPPVTRVRASFIGLKKTEIGVNYSYEKGDIGYGGFAVLSPIDKAYAMIEVDKKKDIEVGYARLGYFIYRGFDLFSDYQYARTFGETSLRAIGFHWMVAPRLEIEFKLSQDDKGNNTSLSQVHLWL